MSSIRAHVLQNPREYCCTGESRKECLNPQYPKHEEDRLTKVLTGPPGCKGFRCTRCKSTVGWCKGSGHGPNHPANNWCDDCYCDVYIGLQDRAREVLNRISGVDYVEISEDPKPTLEICLDRRMKQWERLKTKVQETLGNAGIRCPIIWRAKQ